MAYDPENLVGRRKAALIKRWPDFFKWLSERYGFHLESFKAGEPQHCPVHGGDSGQAFKFFDDFEYTGGGICNSGCIKMMTGDKLVAGWLAQHRAANSETLGKIKAQVEGDSDEELAGGLIDAFLEDREIELPPPKVGTQVTRWINSIDTRIALKYLAKRGLSFNPSNLPESIRGSKRYWAHPDFQNAEGLLALVYGEAERPITHQVILTNSYGEKLGTRPEDQKFLELMAEGSKKEKASPKKLASLAKQEDMSFRYVPLGDESSDTLVLGEGVETVLAGRLVYERLFKAMPMARAMVGSPYQNQQIPDHVKTVYALIDNDHTVESAQEQLEYLASQYSDKSFYMVIPEKWQAGDVPGAEQRKGVPAKGKDWLDSYVRYGVEKSAEIWNQSKKEVQATGKGPAVLKGYNQFNVRPSEKQSGNQPRQYEVVVPISDHRFFRNLNSILKSNTLGWFSDANGEICKVVSGHIVKLDEGSILADMAANLQFLNEIPASRNTKPKEVAFPESRIKRWIKTPQFRLNAASVLPRLDRIQRTFGLGKSDGIWAMNTSTGYWKDQFVFVDVNALHQRAMDHAKNWMSMCERQSELVAMDVALLNPKLGDHIRRSGLLHQSEALVRLTTTLMLEEILEPTLGIKDEAKRQDFYWNLFGSMVASTGHETSLPQVLAIDSRESRDLKRKEACFAIIYLCLLGWAGYSNTAATANPEAVVASIMGWCGVPFKSQLKDRHDSSKLASAVS
jgi:hypothetical protein